MTLYRLKLRPRSPWRTPWQADTLAGMLLATAARVHGSDMLREHLIDPMLAGSPPFVLSDACPGELLPLPISTRLQPWPPDQGKIVKRARWVTRGDFDSLRRGQSVSLAALRPNDDFVVEHARQHNTLSRLTDTTGTAESGLGIFSRPDFQLGTHTNGNPNPALVGADFLSVYVRSWDHNAFDLLLDLFHELALTGFGADVATGRGQFEILDQPEPLPDLDTPPPEANAVVSLSTFQPGPTDPVDGLWDAFPKFGKLGPDLGLPNERTNKRTLIMFRPGACFRTTTRRPCLGRAVPMTELLPETTAVELRGRGINVIHPAFGLCVPAALAWESAT